MTRNLIPIKVIEHPYYGDVLDNITRVPKIKKDGKMYITYKGQSKQVLHTNGEGFHIWIYPEMVGK